MRTFLVRAYFTDRRHDYHELIFDSHKAACRFGLDWFVEDPTVWKLTVTDPVGREDVFTLDESLTRPNVAPTTPSAGRVNLLEAA